MRLAYTNRFLRDYGRSPDRVRRAIDKQLAYLMQDLNHPSLRAKKYDKTRGIWQARVNGGWRFYFRIEGDTYYLEGVIPHPK